MPTLPRAEMTYCMHRGGHTYDIQDIATYYEPPMKALLGMSIMCASSLQGCVDVVDVLEELYRVLGRRVTHVQDAEAGGLDQKSIIKYCLRV